MSKPTNTTITLSPIDARIVYSLNNRSSEIFIDRFTQGKDQFRQ